MKNIISLLILSCIPFISFSQIIYTDVNPDSAVTSQYQLDLNNDGTSEFIIKVVTEGGIKIVKAEGVSLQDSLAGFYGGFPSVVGYPYAMSSDMSIGVANSWVDKGVLGGDHSLIMEDAKWNVGQNRYLGLRFKIGDDVHYGWARLRMETGYTAFTIREYAYNATVGEAINSGITSVEDNYFPISEMLIFPNPSTENAILSFYMNDESEIDLSVYDLSGKLILAETRKVEKPGKQAFQFNVSQWNSGIYFCRINSSTLKLSVVH